jgi:signal transduction histidine kinase
MREWRLNSIATRIAVTIVLAIVLSVALTVALVSGVRHWSGQKLVPGEERAYSAVTIIFGGYNRYRNLPMAAARMATIAEIVSRAPPTDRPAVLAAISSALLHVEIHDEAAIDPAMHLSERLDRLRDAIELSLESQPDMVRVAARTSDGRVADNAAVIDQLEVETRLPDGKWLAITMSDFMLGTILPRAASLAIILVPFLSLIGLLSVLTARRLARPISAFAAAAERFGMGAEAIPLPERGPREVRTAIRAFNRMQERLRRFIDDRTQMVAAMSHDLKTPLTRLRLRAELIRNEAQRRKMLTDMDDMTAMIESTLAFVRDDAKREAPLLVDLGALVESVCENAMDAGGSVDVTAKQGINLTCRPIAISRAVANLIDNALKYGGCARVTLDGDRDRAVVTIDDDGPGIPEEEREKVFAPFYRLEGSRNRDTGGVGLGLAVARTAAREHGGDVTLGTAESGGLRARLELPVSAASTLPAATSSGQKPVGVQACA